MPGVIAQHGLVVAGHPQAAAAGLSVLKSGGSAIDAAIATSLSLAVCEPYASGLGGKLMLLYYDAATHRTRVIDGLDAAGTLDSATYAARPVGDRSYGYPSVCVPGLPAALWLAHSKWGRRKWAQDVQPAIDLAQAGFVISPKSREFFEEQAKKLRRGDPEIARLYLPEGNLPEIGSNLRNPDLAKTLALLAEKGRDGFYLGRVAERIANAVKKGGGIVTLADLAAYEPRETEPLAIDFNGFRIESAPPPTNGAAIYLAVLKVMDGQFTLGALRTAENLDRLGRVWRLVEPEGYRAFGDSEGSLFAFERLVAPDSIRALRVKAGLDSAAKDDAALREVAADRTAMGATTHFVVVDASGNIACVTQSLSVHFGAGVVPPGTGIVLNNSMSNFEYVDSRHPNYVAAGRRPRSTIAPTLVFRGGRPVLALGVPGAARIPSSMALILIDRLVFNRPLGDAIADARFHFGIPWKAGDVDTFEVEDPFPAAATNELTVRGWQVVHMETVGTGRKFSGINAIEFNADGTLTGFADPRRTNSAQGY